MLLNTWEAYYFGVNHNNVVELARQGDRQTHPLSVYSPPPHPYKYTYNNVVELARQGDRHTLPLTHIHTLPPLTHISIH